METSKKYNKLLNLNKRVVTGIAIFTAGVALAGCKTEKDAVIAADCPDNSRLAVKAQANETEKFYGKSVIFGCLKPDGRYIKPVKAEVVDTDVMSIQDVRDSGDGAIRVHAQSEDNNQYPSVEISVNNEGNLSVIQAEMSGYSQEVEAYTYPPSSYR